MAASVKHQLDADLRGSWKSPALPGTLAGDISAAAISATLISPVITAIDRFVLK